MEIKKTRELPPRNWYEEGVDKDIHEVIQAETKNTTTADISKHKIDEAGLRVKDEKKLNPTALSTILKDFTPASFSNAEKKAFLRAVKAKLDLDTERPASAPTELSYKDIEKVAYEVLPELFAEAEKSNDYNKKLIAAVVGELAETKLQNKSIDQEKAIADILKMISKEHITRDSEDFHVRIEEIINSYFNVKE